MAAVPLRMTRLDAFNAHPQPEPPDRELAQVEQGLAGSEGHAIILARGSHAAGQIERCTGRALVRRDSRLPLLQHTLLWLFGAVIYSALLPW